MPKSAEPGITLFLVGLNSTFIKPFAEPGKIVLPYRALPSGLYASSPKSLGNAGNGTDRTFPLNGNRNNRGGAPPGAPSKYAALKGYESDAFPFISMRQHPIADPIGADRLRSWRLVISME